MPYGRLDPADVNAMLKYWYTYRGTIYAGLVHGDPYLVNDPLSVEILGDAYRRPVLGLAMVDNQYRNAADLTWAVPPMTRVSGIVGWDAPFNGKLRFYTPLPEPVDYPTGGTHRHPALELYVGIDS